MKKPILITNGISHTLLVVDIQLTPEGKRQSYTLVNGCNVKVIYTSAFLDRTFNNWVFLYTHNSPSLDCKGFYCFSMQHSQQIGIGSNYTQTKQCFYQNYMRFDLSNVKNPQQMVPQPYAVRTNIYRTCAGSELM